MTTRQAKHQAKQRREGAVKIDVTFKADEPEAAQWAYFVSLWGGPKEAARHLIALARMPR